QLTNGFFDVRFQGRFDPSGLVKGWAIQKAADLLEGDGFVSFCIEAGGDIEVRGANEQGKPWVIGVRSPFETSKIIRTVSLQNRGIATSGTYIRGEHIYNPLTGARAAEIASLTVVGPNVYEADRIATAAFAMGRAGAQFVSSLSDLDCYLIEWSGSAAYTPGFARYLTS
ncbi:MAG TPA: FAD:protein FMN transferase, partial [Spirochaetia bacterium]|nr:FAD:protein FMN transferase [Spirochaetia bacterium]